MRVEVYELFATQVRRRNPQLLCQFEQDLRTLQLLAESDEDEESGEEEMDADHIPARVVPATRRIQEGTWTEHTDVQVVDRVDVETNMIEAMLLIEAGRLS